MKKRRLFAVGILTGLLLMLPAAKVVLAQDASPEVQNDQGPPQDMQGPVRIIRPRRKILLDESRS